MAFTYEESIAKLRQFEGWLTFTDPQRVFLDGVAKGLQPIEAMKVAYPDNKGIVVATKSMLSRVGIQQALDLIGVEYSHANVSKEEALKLLSKHLRKPAIDSAELVKLLSVYSKLSGWDKEDDPKDPEGTVNLDKLVAAIEKKRREG